MSVRTRQPMTDQVREILVDAGFRKPCRVACRRVGDDRYRVTVTPAGASSWDPVVWSALYYIVVQTFRDPGAHIHLHSMIFVWRP